MPASSCISVRPWCRRRHDGWMDAVTGPCTRCCYHLHTGPHQHGNACQHSPVTNRNSSPPNPLMGIRMYSWFAGRNSGIAQIGAPRPARDSGSKPLSFCRPITIRPALSKASTKAKFSQGQSLCAPCPRGGALYGYRSVLCSALLVWFCTDALSWSFVEVHVWSAGHLMGSEIPDRQALMLVMVVVSGHQQARSGAISWHPIPSIQPGPKALVPDLRRVPSPSRH